MERDSRRRRADRAEPRRFDSLVCNGRSFRASSPTKVTIIVVACMYTDVHTRAGGGLRRARYGEQRRARESSSARAERRSRQRGRGGRRRGGEGEGRRETFRRTKKNPRRTDEEGASERARGGARESDTERDVGVSRDSRTDERDQEKEESKRDEEEFLSPPCLSVCLSASTRETGRVCEGEKEKERERGPHTNGDCTCACVSVAGHSAGRSRRKEEVTGEGCRHSRRWVERGRGGEGTKMTIIVILIICKGIVDFHAGQVRPQWRYIMTKTRRVGWVPFARQKARR